ncbi:DNA repair protein Rad1 [Aspergillus sclerotialis]|uniref:DNA repair protein Rad1 n=1 Tax=Aspergillus sclerotialis TaxID=2070753 RepID=A0A3A2ZUG5_9EURO|nr:DNA repair protein Rad1 [Aspergillus sclerotialis]
MADAEPIFAAVSSNAHHLYTLLQCIGFAPKATVQITPDGIRFSAEGGRVIQGLAFLDKALFTTYTFNPPSAPNIRNEDSADNDNSTDTTYYPHFVISLSALLETLKIFGINDTATSSSSKPSIVQPSHPPSSNAFTTPALLLDRTCTLQYSQPGSPLSITLSEAGVKTTCELTTYEPDEDEADIPLQRDAIIMKIIMRSAWLHNAISELDSTNPTVLRISASAKQEPYFSLSGAGGPFSESVVEFSVDQQNQANGSQAQPHHKVLADDGTSRARAKRATQAPTVTETFLVSPPSSMGSHIRQDYRFPLIRKASRAMAAASKVSIRGDKQGVLSLQFMIDFEESNGPNAARSTGGSMAGNVAFVDFRFVPLLDENEAADEE